MEFDWTGVVDYSKRTPVEVPKTQYELPGVTEEDHAGVPVAVVPLWHSVVTAKITFPAGDQAALVDAQQRSAVALAEVERVYPLSPRAGSSSRSPAACPTSGTGSRPS